MNLSIGNVAKGFGVYVGAPVVLGAGSVGLGSIAGAAGAVAGAFVGAVIGASSSLAAIPAPLGNMVYHIANEYAHTKTLPDAQALLDNGLTVGEYMRDVGMGWGVAWSTLLGGGLAVGAGGAATGYLLIKSGQLVYRLHKDFVNSDQASLGGNNRMTNFS
jgi:hypothetical protein